MSKIKSISVLNLKAVASQSADFNGCTAIVTGGNNKGKTSFLRTTIDRIQGIKPSIVLKQNEKDGFGEIILTDGCKFRWEFKEGGKEKLVYVTEKEIKTAATREICDRYFPGTFDVDKFLNDSPQKQRKTLQDLAGLDFTDIDTRYDAAYKERTAANTRAGDAKTVFDATVPPAPCEAVDLHTLNTEKENVRKELNDQYVKNKKQNDDVRESYNNSLTEFRNNCDKWNNEQANRSDKIKFCNDLLNQLQSKGYEGKEVEHFIASLPKSTPHNYVRPVEPTYIQELPDNAPLLAVEEKITKAIEQNKNASLYQSWVALQAKNTETAELATKANDAVKLIETERMDLIKSANMPEGFAFTDDGISYNGLAFTREQLSSSGIYIAALKLASMKIGEVRTLHFDASFLDNNSLAEIEAWATAQDLQLLIEQPDREGGEIEYQIITQ